MAFCAVLGCIVPRRRTILWAPSLMARVRFGLGAYNTIREVDTALHAVAELARSVA